MIGSDLTVIMPELALAVYAMIALVVMVYAGKDKRADLSLYLTSAVLVGAALLPSRLSLRRPILNRIQVSFIQTC